MLPATKTSPKTASRRRSTSEPSVEQLVAEIRERAESLARHAAADELIDEANRLRSELSGDQSVTRPEILIAGLALATEALRRSHNVQLYDVQIQAAVELTRGRVAQMQTGEGKTYVAIAVATHLALAGLGVHVATPNAYLAERDCRLATPVLAALQMTAGLLPERVEAAQKRPAYDCDVTYATGNEYGFDYLRDQLTLRQEAGGELGSGVLRRLNNPDPDQRRTMQRGLVFCIVDEADSVLIDDAGSPLVLSIASTGPAPDESVHRAACDFVGQLEQPVHFRIDPASGHVALTETGLTRCYQDDVAIPSAHLLRPWTQYVEQALRARYLFRRHVHYVVADDEVRIVDESTGRIFEDRSWQDGLHQAIEAREGLPVSAEKEAAARITRQRFFRLYRNLCGMTGTAIGCEQEFAAVYGKAVAAIPLRVPSARVLLPTRFFATADAKRDAIRNSVAEQVASGRPVLVGTRSIVDSEILARLLDDCGIPHELLNGLQSAEEADVVARAGRSRSVTIATNLAGRGTDIALDPAVREHGGLHVIVAECQLSGRMDRQLIGRCARQGDPGSAQTFVSAEDSLLQRYGQWLASAIVRDAGPDDESPTDFSSYVARVQAAAERAQFVARRNLLQHDASRDSLFA
ncbi:MAG: translocase [Planctomycetaceae bacterium]